MLDNVFFHDHVDGLHTWQRGMVGQIVVEPQGSTYHDPETGAEIRSGTLADIHTTNPLIPGVINGSFREFAYMPIDQVAGVDSTINLRAEPLAGRGTDPSLWFSSTTFGDPYTPMPKAYPGDPLVIRTISANPSVDTLHVDGMRFFKDPRYTDATGNESTPINTFHQMVSEKFTVAMDGGAGGPQHTPGRLPLRQRRRAPHQGRRLGPDPGARRLRPVAAAAAGLPGAGQPGHGQHRHRRPPGRRRPGQSLPGRRTGEVVLDQRGRRQVEHVRQRRPVGVRAPRASPSR